MRYWFLPLIFALCASAHFHDKPHDNHAHDPHPNKTPDCAKDEIRGRDGKCEKCLPGQIRNSSGVCMCEPGSTLINGQCVFPPCPDGQIRINTHCFNPCPEGLIFTNNRCVVQECLPNQIRVSSGACMCEPGSTLINGQCVFPPCPEGQMRINTHCVPICPEGHIFSNGQCVVIQECLPGQIRLSSGACICESGSTLIDGKCVFPPCPEGQTRVNTHCVPMCPEGYVFSNGQCVRTPGTEKAPDGGHCQPKCQPCPTPCPDGQVLVNNKCVCTHGQVMKDNKCACPDGTQYSSTTELCEKIPPRGGCPSGVQTGKCYTFTFGNGNLLGYNSSAGLYTASSDQQFSKFQVCANESCSPTPTEDIKAGVRFNLQEISGPIPPTSSQKSKFFVSNPQSGAYLTRASDFSHGGRFIITKWPGGKHCLGGDTVGLAYRTGGVGVTTAPSEDQSCIIVTLTEVPCDIRATEANCIAGNKTETLASPPGGKGTANASMPVYN